MAQRCLYVGPTETVVVTGHALIRGSAPEMQPMLFPQTYGIKPSNDFTPFLIDKDTALKIAKAIPRKGEPETLLAAVDCSTETEDDAKFAVNELVRQDVITSRKLDAKYPDYSKHIPEGNGRFLIAFNPDLLAEIATVINNFCANRGAAQVTIRLYGPESGIRFDAEGDGQHLTAIVMPQRIIQEDSDAP